MAAVAGGTVVGNVVLGRWASAGVRARLMWPMAVAIVAAGAAASVWDPRTVVVVAAVLGALALLALRATALRGDAVRGPVAGIPEQGDGIP